jgi:hypothetical protein
MGEGAYWIGFKSVVFGWMVDYDTPWMDGCLAFYGMFRSGHEGFLDGCFD